MIPPSPKSQFHMVGFPVERSVNWTVSGASPLRGDAVKSALIPGVTCPTVMNACFVSVSDDPYWFDAVRVTV